jgi:hypothetical protein
MYQHHFPIGDIEGFKWYVGGGALVQFYSYDNYDSHDYSETGFALNAVGGVDYKFRDIPLNLSADIMPAIFISRTPDDFVGYGGISVRYTFR